MFLGSNSMSSLQDFWTAFIVISFLVFKAHAGQELGKLQKTEQAGRVSILERKKYFQINRLNYL